MNNRFGQTLKHRRLSLAMSQRKLAALLGVKASHVGYLENGRRRPSLSLLNRLANVLSLGKKQLFLLAHPDAKHFIGERAAVPRDERDHSWREFRHNKPLLARHAVSPRELRVLAQVNLLGKVSSPRNYLFILNAIRQAVDDEG